MQNEIVETLKQIKAECKEKTCKDCSFYLTGKVMDECFFAETPNKWMLSRLKLPNSHLE